MTSRILYPAFLTPTRVWASHRRQDRHRPQQGRQEGGSARTGRTTPSPHRPAVAGVTATCRSARATWCRSTGERQPRGGANIDWRTAVGGINNHDTVRDRHARLRFRRQFRRGLRRPEGWDRSSGGRKTTPTASSAPTTSSFTSATGRASSSSTTPTGRPTRPVSGPLPLSGIDLQRVQCPRRQHGVRPHLPGGGQWTHRLPARYVAEVRPAGADLPRGRQSAAPRRRPPVPAGGIRAEEAVPKKEPEPKKEPGAEEGTGSEEGARPKKKLSPKRERLNGRRAPGDASYLTGGWLPVFRF